MSCSTLNPARVGVVVTPPQSQRARLTSRRLGRTPSRLHRIAETGLAVAFALGLCSCNARPVLPTLSLHAVLVVRHAAANGREKQSHDLGLQAQLSFRGRRETRPSIQTAARNLPLPMLPNCEHALLCQWAELSEESALLALGITP